MYNTFIEPRRPVFLRTLSLHFRCMYSLRTTIRYLCSLNNRKRTARGLFGTTKSTRTVVWPRVTAQTSRVPTTGVFDKHSLLMVTLGCAFGKVQLHKRWPIACLQPTFTKCDASWRNYQCLFWTHCLTKIYVYSVLTWKVSFVFRSRLAISSHSDWLTNNPPMAVLYLAVVLVLVINYVQK